jgi:acyl carrier protein
MRGRQGSSPYQTERNKEIMEDRDTLLATLVSLLEEEMGDTFGRLEETTDLREGLGLDSVDVVGLVMRVERQFRIRMAMEELMEVKRVGHLLDLVQAKLEAKSGATMSELTDLRTTAA